MTEKETVIIRSLCSTSSSRSLPPSTADSFSLSALLQERFRQLERVREKREAREKIAAPTCNSKTGFERKSSPSSSNLSLGMMNTSPRRQRKALFVAYDRELNRENDVKRRQQRLTNWWPDCDNSVVANFSTTSSDQISEVDTSLHL